MIEEFRNSEIRDSAVIYKSTFEQVKKLYAKSPEQAGELAIAAMELALTGEISSDNFMIDLILEDMREINKRNQIKYNKKEEAKRQQKIADQKLDMIAELHMSGLTQKQIADRIGTTQQTVSSRIATIKTDYPELLQAKLNNLQALQVIQGIQEDVNENVNENVNYGNSCADAQALQVVCCGKPQPTKRFCF